MQRWTATATTSATPSPAPRPDVANSILARQEGPSEKDLDSMQTMWTETVKPQENISTFLVTQKVT